MRTVLFASIIALATVGCSASQKATESADLHAALNCAEAAVLPILGTVTTIIVTGGVGWEAALDQIGAQAGSLAEACAVKTVETVLAAPTATPKTALDPAYARANGFIATKGWTFK